MKEFNFEKILKVTVADKGDYRECEIYFKSPEMKKAKKEVIKSKFKIGGICKRLEKTRVIKGSLKRKEYKTIMFTTKNVIENKYW
jgi:hypothetical protein